MGFYSGRVSYLRFKVNGPAPRLFGEEHLDRLADRQAGRQRIASADGVETGWTAGDHVLDTDFALAKNIINDTLHFELRVDTDRIPGDLLRAYYAVELKALSKDNPSGFPSARQNVFTSMMVPPDIILYPSRTLIDDLKDSLTGCTPKASTL